MEGVVCDVLSASQEGVYGIFEECSVVAVHVERNGDSPAHFHILYVEVIFLKRQGVGPSV